jgi:uncharacterized protein with HEPN domain
MPPDQDTVYLSELLNAVREIVSSLEGITSAQYAANENLRLATVQRLEIIMEASRHISAELKEANPQIPWHLIDEERS